MDSTRYLVVLFLLVALGFLIYLATKPKHNKNSTSSSGGSFGSNDTVSLNLGPLLPIEIVPATSDNTGPFVFPNNAADVVILPRGVFDILSNGTPVSWDGGPIPLVGRSECNYTLSLKVKSPLHSPAYAIYTLLSNSERQKLAKNPSCTHIDTVSMCT